MNIKLAQAQAIFSLSSRLPNIPGIVQSRLSGGKQAILIACFPKSGSTYIFNKLGAIPGFKQAAMVPAFERREQEIEANSIEQSMLRYPIHNIVAQNHTRCSLHTVSLIKKFAIRTVVLTRNLRDCLVSVTDHWINEDAAGPMAYLDAPLLHDCKEKKLLLSAAVQLYGPWYINFYLTWQTYLEYLPLELKPIELDYNHFFSDPTQSLVQLLDSLGYQASPDEIHSIIPATKEDRFNVGKAGRGKDAFDEDRKADIALRSLLDLYAKHDLSRILD